MGVSNVSPFLPSSSSLTSERSVIYSRPVTILGVLANLQPSGSLSHSACNSNSLSLLLAASVAPCFACSSYAMVIVLIVATLVVILCMKLLQEPTAVVTASASINSSSSFWSNSVRRLLRLDDFFFPQ